VTNEEKTSLKAACLQAATTLIAARDAVKGVVDVDECVKLAAELYCRFTVMNWEQREHDICSQREADGSGKLRPKPITVTVGPLSGLSTSPRSLENAKR
jgi:hypothetical protein